MGKAAIWILTIVLAVVTLVRWHQIGSLTVWLEPIPILIGMAMRRTNS
jgi:hypothetical protein